MKISLPSFFSLCLCLLLSLGLYSQSESASATSYAASAQQLLTAAVEEGDCAGIASIAKPMTAIGIMQLVEKEKVDLDAPLQTYLSDFPEKKEGTITLRQLLQHASGIPAYAKMKEQENTQDYPDLKAAMDIFQNRELLSKPGAEFNYTSYGYVVLGRVIEEVSGMSYEAYMQKNIWDPAGMSQTGIEVYQSDHPEKTSIYHRKKAGKIKLAQETNLSDRIPGGGLYATVEDLLRFGEAVLNNKLISETSLQAMMQDSGLKKEENAYGLGWYLYGKNPKYGEVIGHTGGQTGCSAMFMLMPEVKTVIVSLSNTSGAMQRVSNVAVGFFPLAEQAGQE